MMTMRTPILTLAIVLGSSVAAFAGGSIKDAPMVPVAMPTWTGPYIGVHAGVAHSDNRVDDVNLLQADPINPVDISKTGALGGFHAGYLWDINRIVFGIETDITFGSLTHRRAIDTSTLDDSTGTTIGTRGTLRGKLGIASGNFLVYGTGGLAVAHIRNASIDTDGGVFDPGDTADRRKWETGWVAGAGVTLAATQNVRVTAEWLHSDFGSVTVVTPGGDPFTFKNKLDEFRLGLAYKF
jgi:outer membrane immunogenic protein